MDIVTQRLTFAWWNTGLSPVGRDRATEPDRDTAAGIVASLFKDFRVDILGLGEITLDDLSYLANALLTADVSIYDGTLRAGRAQFDTGAIYNNQTLLPRSDATSTLRHGNKLLKLLNRLDMYTPADKSPFHVFLSHWPSPIVPDSESSRVTHGAQLRIAVNDIRQNYNGDARIVLMGDFNQEPFDESLAGQLLATRDRRMATRNSSYLYNPFWRHLGESHPYVYGRTMKSFGGTCVLPAGHLTKWKTVDQIIVSSIFLGGSEWHLNESLTQVLHLTPRGCNPSAGVGIFDHFPVITVLERHSQVKG